MLKRLISICLCTFMLCTMIFVPSVSADGTEMSVFYDPCQSLDNAWSSTNLQVVNDVIGDANYNNGGYMIQPAAANEKCEIVYKVPEGRNFVSFYTEISMQNLTEVAYPVIKYSENGEEYTDFNGGWGSSLGTPGSGQNNAGWAHKYGQMVTAPENTNIRFIKIYKDAAQMNNVIKFNIRKISMITEGGAVSGNVTDSMSGAEKLNYEISNLMPYALYCYNNKRTEAEEIATLTDKFSDSDLLVVRDLAKDAYVTYKAADGKVFSSVEINEVIRDSGKNIKVYASTDGDDYVEITPNSTRIGYIHSSTASGAPGACWNSNYVTTAAFDKTAGYKYIKLMHPAGNLSNANHYKLASATFTTATDAESTVVSQGFKEDFAGTDNLYGLSGIFASAAESRFRPTSDAVSEGKTEPVYAMYKIADGKRFGYVKAKFTQVDIYSKNYVDVIALDENKEVITWDSSSLWTEDTYQGASNQFTEFVLYGEVPSNAKYLKLQMSYLDDNWRCVINGFEVYGPYDGSIYSVDGETETDLNGTLTAGNIKGKVTFENLDSGTKNVYAVAALKENDMVVNVAVEPHTLSQAGTVTLDTGVIEGCAIGENTTFEIYLFDVTDGALTPILPQKIAF